jgi:hypothetical protein
MKRIILISVALLLLGCGKDDPFSGSSGIPAPSSLDGKTVLMIVNEGSGILAPCGSFTVVFGTSSYRLIGDGFCVSDSQGTYSYAAQGHIGTPVITDATLGVSAQVQFAYTNATSGAYRIFSSVGNQSGSFFEQ